MYIIDCWFTIHIAISLVTALQLYRFSKDCTFLVCWHPLYVYTQHTSLRHVWKELSIKLLSNYFLPASRENVHRNMYNTHPLQLRIKIKILNL